MFLFIWTPISFISSHFQSFGLALALARFCLHFLFYLLAFSLLLISFRLPFSMDFSFIWRLEISSTSNSEKEVEKPNTIGKKSSGDSSSDEEKLGSIRVVGKSDAKNPNKLEDLKGSSSIKV